MNNLISTKTKTVSKKKSSPKARKWCITSFKKDINWKKIYEDNKDIIRYVIVQGEITPTTKKFHWQAYIQMINQCRMRALKLMIGDLSMHLEIARGTAEDNKEYCSKIRTSTGEKYEFGKAVSQGHRSDLEQIKKRLDDGCSMQEVADNHFGDYIRYHSGFHRYKDMCDKKLRSKRRNVTGILKVGPTGTGKTMGTLDEYGDDNVYIMTFEKSEWFDGYNGEKVLLIDDYNNDIKVNRMLQLMNGCKCRLPVKGGFTYANWDTVILTSNLTLDELHSNAKVEHRKAFFRRFQKVNDGYAQLTRSVDGNTYTSTRKYKLDEI